MQSYVSFCVLTRLFLCLEKKTLTYGLIFYRTFRFVFGTEPNGDHYNPISEKPCSDSPTTNTVRECYAQSIYHGWTAVGVTVKEGTEGVML